MAVADADAMLAKLVLTGPVGAGKTTAIRSLTDQAPVSTEMPLSEGATEDKSTTTVALDFSSTVLEDGTTLLVYGVPGQDRFAFMRPIILRDALGVAVVLSALDPDVAGQCGYWLREILADDPTMPVVIGITHTDRLPSFNMSPIRAVVNDLGAEVPVFTFDARDREQAFHLVRALLLIA